MTKKRFGNGGSRGGRSGRGRRRAETEHPAAPASGAAAAAERAAQPEEAAGADAADGSGAGSDPRGPDGGAPDGGAPVSEAPVSEAPVSEAAGAAGARDTVPDAAAESAADAAPCEVAQAEQLDQLRGQIATLQDELLRKQADFENFRKRINRDKEEAIKFANKGLLLDLTAVLDDFERASSAAAQSEDFATLRSGIELIEKQLLSTLQRKWGLTRFESAGQPFDPERHEALTSAPSADHTETTVIEDYQKGYTLHGRVIRAARVRVVTPLERAAGDRESAAKGV